MRCHLVRWVLLLAISPGAATAGAPVAAAAGGALPLPEPGSDAWQPLHFPSIEKHTRYEALASPQLDGRIAWRASATCSASAMVLPLVDLDLERTPRLSWRWRVEKPLANPQEQTKAGDDFAARVYVMFRFEPEHASLLRRAQQRLGTALFGNEPPGVALNFVWASRLPSGSRWPNPYSSESKMFAIRGADAAGKAFIREEVDLVGEHQRQTGRAAAAPLALAIMTDADGLCADAVAWYGDFQLLPPQPRTEDPAS